MLVKFEHSEVNRCLMFWKPLDPYKSQINLKTAPYLSPFLLEHPVFNNNMTLTRCRLLTLWTLPTLQSRPRPGDHPALLTLALPGLPGHPGAGPAGLAGQGHTVVSLIVPALARGLTN